MTAPDLAGGIAEWAIVLSIARPPPSRDQDGWFSAGLRGIGETVRALDRPYFPGGYAGKAG
jgi:hypothetical protein